MIAKPTDYETAQSYDSDFSRLPAGGYICEIKSLEEGVSSTGKQMVIINFDIADGEYKDYFAKLYKHDKASNVGRDAKWRGRYFLFPTNPDGTTNPSFKGAMVCIQNSNQGFEISWPLNLDSFRGRRIGLLFREEESFWEGRVIVNVRPCAARSVDCIFNGEFNVPKKKELNDDQKQSTGASSNAAGTGTQKTVYSTQADSTGFTVVTGASSNAAGTGTQKTVYSTQEDSTGFTVVDDDDLPF